MSLLTTFCLIKFEKINHGVVKKIYTQAFLFRWSFSYALNDSKFKIVDSKQTLSVMLYTDLL